MSLKGLPNLGVRRRIDVVDFYRTAFAKYAARCVNEGTRVLDAAAGECPDAALFRHAKYESCDWQQNHANSHSFLCDLRAIPAPDSTYDAVLCFLALDDAAEPQKWIDEFFRILKPGGQLLITAPLNGRVHGVPYHFFHFGRFGLDFLFKTSGFQILRVNPWGGIFGCLSHFCYKLPRYLNSQYSQQCTTRRAPALQRLVLQICYGLSMLVFYWILPFVFFYCDRLDRQKDFTIGYDCHCRKPG